MSESNSEEVSALIWDVLLAAMLAVTALAIFALPVFPSQDGPVHLYYTDVLRDLITHSGNYSSHFAVRSVLTPYVFENYLLLALETMFPPLISEKALIVIYIFSFGLGLRYLMNSVVGRPTPWTLVALPFCMHFQVYMGFMNFCFGVTFAVALCGQWIRWSRSGAGAWLLMPGFLLLSLTHPVCVAVFLMFAGSHLAADFLASVVGQRQAWMTALRSHAMQVTMLGGMGLVSLLWIGSFMKYQNPIPAGGRYDPGVSLSWLQIMLGEIKLWPLLPVRSVAYELTTLAGLYVPAALALGAAWTQRARLSVASWALLTTSSLCFLAYGLVPGAVNGSFYLEMRFPIFWMLFLVVLLAAIAPPGKLERPVALIAVAATVAAVGMQWRLVRPISEELGRLAQGTMERGSVGMILTMPARGPVTARERPQLRELRFDPYFWFATHYFRNSRAILFNAPWMDLPFMSLSLRQPVPGNYLDPYPESKYLLQLVNAKQALPKVKYLVSVGGATEVKSIANAYGFGPADLGGGPLQVYTPLP